MIRFIVAAVLIVLCLFHKEPLKAENINIEKIKMKEKPDSGALFDRFATRFGAFAIVAVICHALIRDSTTIFNALQYSLPGLEASYDNIYLTFFLTTIVLLFTLTLGISTLLPIFSWFEITSEDAGIIKSIGLAFILVFVFIFYATVVVVLMFSEDLLPALNDDTRVLRHIHICASEGLSEALCQEALFICDKAAGPDACIEAVRRHRDTMPDDG